MQWNRTGITSLPRLSLLWETYLPPWLCWADASVNSSPANTPQLAVNLEQRSPSIGHVGYINATARIHLTGPAGLAVLPPLFWRCQVCSALLDMALGHACWDHAEAAHRLLYSLPWRAAADPQPQESKGWWEAEREGSGGTMFSLFALRSWVGGDWMVTEYISKSYSFTNVFLRWKGLTQSIYCRNLLSLGLDPGCYWKPMFMEGLVPTSACRGKSMKFHQENCRSTTFSENFLK